jgi:hypothetical protein
MQPVTGGHVFIAEATWCRLCLRELLPRDAAMLGNGLLVHESCAHSPRYEHRVKFSGGIVTGEPQIEQAPPPEAPPEAPPEVDDEERSGRDE